MKIDFFFSYGSTYSYLSIMRVEKLAQEAGVPVDWRPFLARKIMEEQNNRPFLGKPVKTKYMWRDVERRAAQFGIPFNGVPPYPITPTSLPHRVGLVAKSGGWCPDFTKAVYRAWFMDHKELGQPRHLAEALAALGHDAEKVLAEAATSRMESALEDETNEARRLGIFGSPTFVVGDEIFWGDDRLEIALDWAVRHAGRTRA